MGVKNTHRKQAQNPNKPEGLKVLGPSESRGMQWPEGRKLAEGLHEKHLDFGHYFLILTLEHKEAASWGG